MSPCPSSLGFPSRSAASNARRQLRRRGPVTKTAAHTSYLVMGFRYWMDRTDRTRPGSDRAEPDRVCAALLAQRSIQALSVDLDSAGEDALKEVLATTQQRLREVEQASRQRIEHGESEPIRARVAVGIGLRRVR